jgi:hypothetical protein
MAIEVTMPIAPAPSTISGNGSFKNAIPMKASIASAQASRDFSARFDTLISASTTIASTAAFNPNRMPATTGKSP